MRSYLYLATIALAVSPPITAQSNNLGQRQDYSQQSMKMTFYGYPDNCDPTGCYSSPEGNYVAYDCQNPNGQSRGYKAGGDGTWNNPLSIAGELDQCSIIYIPYLRKYGIIDDRCYGCGTAHIDIWVESQCDDDFDNVCKCEFSLTPDQKQCVHTTKQVPTWKGIHPQVYRNTHSNISTETCLLLHQVRSGIRVTCHYGSSIR